jgi:hypothetical protein
MALKYSYNNQTDLRGNSRRQTSSPQSYNTNNLLLAPILVETPELLRKVQISPDHFKIGAIRRPQGYGEQAPA